MKKLVFISTLILLSFSCQKERLKDHKEIFIGKWELQYAIENKWRNGSPRKIDTIFPCNSPATLTFKKSGRVFLNKNEEEVKYKMNLKRDHAYLRDEIKEIYLDSDTGKVLFLENQSFFSANFHDGIGETNRTRVAGTIGKDWLRIRSSSKIISEYQDGTRVTIYYNFFKRVN